MDCGQFCLRCCVGICCRECSWLGVCRMLRSGVLVMGCKEGCMLYLRVRRGGWYRQFVVLWSVFCVGGIYSRIGSPNNSYVYFCDMFLIFAACLLFFRIRVCFVGCALHRWIVDYWILCRSRGSVLAFSTQVCGFKPGRSLRIFRAKKFSARLPSEGK